MFLHFREHWQNGQSRVGLETTIHIVFHKREGGKLGVQPHLFNSLVLRPNLFETISSLKEKWVEW